MRSLTIPVTSDIGNYLERLMYETMAKKNVIATLIENNQDNPDFLTSPLFLEYNTDYLRTQAEFQNLQDEIVNQLVPDYLRKHTFNYTIDPYTQSLKVEVTCSCPIPELDGGATE